MGCRTRDGKLKIGRIEPRSLDGTYRPSNGMAGTDPQRIHDLRMHDRRMHDRVVPSP